MEPVQTESAAGTKIVLTGVARSKGQSVGQTLVSKGRMGWGYNHVGDEDGIVLLPNSNIQVRMRDGQDRCYPTVLGSTLRSVGLFYKVQESHVGPAGIICQQVHYIDIAGAIAAEIPAVDSLDQLVGDRNDRQVEPLAD